MVTSRPGGARRGTRWPRLALAMATGLLSAALLVPVRSAAISAVPDERVAARDLPFLAAMVGDVDGDDVRELVRVLPWATNPTQLAVAVNSLTADGGVADWGQAALRREAVPDDLDRPGVGPAQDGLRPVLTGEPAQLIAWEQNGQERVLVATIGTQGLDRPCCLTLWLVEGTAASGLTLVPMGETHSSATSVVAADLDGDSTDELVLVAPQELQRPGIEFVSVFAWNGKTFGRLGTPIQVPAGAAFADVGEMDGRPGDEVAAVLPRDPVIGAPSLRVLRLLDGVPKIGATELPFGGSAVGVRGPDGPRVVIASDTSPTVLVDLRDRRQPVVATSPRRGTPLAVLGTGPEARILLLRDQQFVDVLNANLAPREGMFGGAAAAPFLDSPLPPYVGPLPGGLSKGVPAVIFRGRLGTAPRSAAGARSIVTTTLMAALPGSAPIGLLGPSSSWLALADDPAAVTTRRGGRLLPDFARTADRATIVQASEVLDPEKDDGVLDPPIVDAVPANGQPARPVLVTREQPTIEIAAPAGTRISIETTKPTGGRAGAAEPAPRKATVRASGRLKVAIAPPPGTASGASFSARLLLSTPAGHGYGAVWEVRVVREPPPLSAHAAAFSFSSRVPVQGATAPLASVTVDGQPAGVASDGSFTATVDAGVLPRDVVIVSRDRIGNMQRVTVSVVAFVDYRSLPWIPIVVLLTLLAAVVLYRRAPRTRMPRRGGDGTLEELD